jgi:GDPmannose 4,6-dehydratase
MLQQDEPNDYVVATGSSHSVRSFVEATFRHFGLDWTKHVEIDPRYFRPAEVDHLLGDASKAAAALGWRPRVGFDELVTMMAEHDLELARQEKTLRDAGHVHAAAGPTGTRIGGARD